MKFKDINGERIAIPETIYELQWLEDLILKELVVYKNGDYYLSGLGVEFFKRKEKD